MDQIKQKMQVYNEKHGLPPDLDCGGFPNKSWPDWIKQLNVESENFRNICDCIKILFPNKIGQINRRISSYGLKHLVERYRKKYVYNGEVIAAMIKCGFKTSERIGPNCYFNIKTADLRKIKLQDE